MSDRGSRVTRGPALTLPDGRDPVEAWLAETVAIVCERPFDAVTPVTRLGEAGLDARGAARVAAEIERALGVPADAVVVDPGDTVGALAAKVVAAVPLAPARLRLAATVTPRRTGSAHVRIDRRDSGITRMRHLYKRPTDPTIYTVLELDATEVQAWLQARRDREPRVTIEHVVVKAVAEALRRHPDANARMRFGRLVDRSTVSVTAIVSVVTESGRAVVRNVQIEHAGRKDIWTIVREARLHQSHAVQTAGRGSRDLLGRVPDPLWRPMLALLRWLDVNPGRDHFSSAAVSNVGAFGGAEDVYAEGWAPLTRQFPIHWAVAIPQIRRVPVARGDAVEIRPVLRLHHSFDHRVFSGALIASVYAVIAECFREPETFLGD